MDIYKLVFDTLTPLGLPLSASAYIAASGTNLPDAVLGYSLTSTPLLFADDVELVRRHDVQVFYFNKAGLSSIPNVEGLMKAAGFKYADTKEMPYDPDTRYFGVELDFTYLENME